jgi:Fe-S cluster assembly ATP-binding protein
MRNILEIRDLSVEVNKKKILHDINITMREGQSCVMFGPNGSGKTSLLMTIMGVPNYPVEKGRILFEGRDITEKTVDERARLGIGIGFQLPQEIRGLRLIDMLKIAAGKKLSQDLSLEEKKLVSKFMLDGFLDRDVNLNFSGGEKKRAEILQLLFMKPRLLLLDEPDSGVDLESLKLIGEEIQRYVEENNASALVITHQGHILDHMRAEKACVLLGNTIYDYNEPQKILEHIKRNGYKGCLKCRKRRRRELNR